MNTSKYETFFSLSALHVIAGAAFKKVGKTIVDTCARPAFQLAYAALDPSCPNWVRGVCFGAAGYFICPMDLVPDVIPLIGYSDDAAVLAAAVLTAAAHINDDVKAKAESALQSLFGDFVY
jgi:uncharacterized membrane protein YkvA (DUF1232 family)